MVIWIDEFIKTRGLLQFTQCDVRNHLIGIHVSRRARTALQHIDDELVICLASDHPVASA